MLSHTAKTLVRSFALVGSACYFLLVLYLSILSIFSYYLSSINFLHDRPLSLSPSLETSPAHLPKNIFVSQLSDQSDSSPASFAGSSSLSLQRYESARYATNHVLMGVVDKLHKLYSVRAGPLVPLRSWGLASVNALSPLKSWFMRTAAGENIST